MAEEYNPDIVSVIDENGVEHTVKPEFCAFCWFEEKEQ